LWIDKLSQYNVCLNTFLKKDKQHRDSASVAVFDC